MPGKLNTRKMALHLTLLLAVVGGILYGAQNCKPNTPGLAALKEAGDQPTEFFEVCKCGDSACWNRETTKRSHENLKCGLKELPGIVNPVVDIVAGLAFAVVEFQKAKTDLQAIVAGLGEAQSALKLAKEVAPGCAGAGIGVSADLTAITGKMATLVDKAIAAKKQADAGSFEAKFFSDYLTTMAEALTSVVKLVPDLGKLADCAKPLKDAKTVTFFANAYKNLSKVERMFKDLKPANKLDAVVKIGGCGIKIIRGAHALVNNSICLGRDLAALAESNKQVAHALAYVGSRQYNHAKFIGCKECVKDTGTLTATGDVDLESCRSCCEDKGNGVVPEAGDKRSNWTISCQLSCAIARKEDLIGAPVTDESACKEVLTGVNPVSQTYRNIFLTAGGDNMAERYRQAGEQRGNVLAHLKTIAENFATFDTGSPGGAGPDGDIGLVDFTALAGNAGVAGPIRDAAKFFGEAYVQGDGKPYFFTLLASADPNGNADLVNSAEVGYFKDEVSEYRDESEFKNPADFAASAGGGGDYGGVNECACFCDAERQEGLSTGGQCEDLNGKDNVCKNGAKPAGCEFVKAGDF